MDGMTILGIRRTERGTGDNCLTPRIKNDRSSQQYAELDFNAQAVQLIWMTANISILMLFLDSKVHD